MKVLIIVATFLLALLVDPATATSASCSGDACFVPKSSSFSYFSPISFTFSNWSPSSASKVIGYIDGSNALVPLALTAFQSISFYPPIAGSNLVFYACALNTSTYSSCIAGPGVSFFNTTLSIATPSAAEMANNLSAWSVSVTDGQAVSSALLTFLSVNSSISSTTAFSAAVDNAFESLSFSASNLVYLTYLQVSALWPFGLAAGKSTILSQVGAFFNLLTCVHLDTIAAAKYLAFYTTTLVPSLQSNANFSSNSTYFAAPLDAILNGILKDFPSIDDTVAVSSGNVSIYAAYALQNTIANGYTVPLNLSGGVFASGEYVLRIGSPMNSMCSFNSSCKNVGTLLAVAAFPPALGPASPFPLAQTVGSTFRVRAGNLATQTAAANLVNLTLPAHVAPSNYTLIVRLDDYPTYLDAWASTGAQSSTVTLTRTNTTVYGTSTMLGDFAVIKFPAPPPPPSTLTNKTFPSPPSSPSSPSYPPPPQTPVSAPIASPSPSPPPPAPTTPSMSLVSSPPPLASPSSPVFSSPPPPTTPSTSVITPPPTITTSLPPPASSVTTPSANTRSVSFPAAVSFVPSDQDLEVLAAAAAAALNVSKSMVTVTVAEMLGTNAFTAAAVVNSHRRRSLLAGSVSCSSDLVNQVKSMLAAELSIAASNISISCYSPTDGTSAKASNAQPIYFASTCTTNSSTAVLSSGGVSIIAQVAYGSSISQDAVLAALDDILDSAVTVNGQALSVSACSASTSSSVIYVSAQIDSGSNASISSNDVVANMLHTISENKSTVITGSAISDSDLAAGQIDCASPHSMGKCGAAASGSIAGATVGSVTGVALLATFGVYFQRKRKSKSSGDEGDAENGPNSQPAGPSPGVVISQI